MFTLPLQKKLYVDNGKYLDGNAQAKDAFKHTLSKKYLSIVSHCDSTVVVWNTLTSLKEQASNNLERKPVGDESDEACYSLHDPRE